LRQKSIRGEKRMPHQIVPIALAMILAMVAICVGSAMVISFKAITGFDTSVTMKVCGATLVAGGAVAFSTCILAIRGLGVQDRTATNTQPPTRASKKKLSERGWTLINFLALIGIASVVPLILFGVFALFFVAIGSFPLWIWLIPTLLSIFWYIYYISGAD
jgi:hypothetical protein